MTTFNIPRALILATALAGGLLPSFVQAVWSVGASGDLSTQPQTLIRAVPPNVMFSLSVEYPTADTAAYCKSAGAADCTYSSARDYLGLFDHGKCYDYSDGNEWFYPVGKATDHVCAAGRWSGNFLNWAAMTGLDEFRFAMTGGNRYRDTATETVLERTYIDAHGGTGNFPNKSFTGSGATPYSAAAALTIANATKGISMAVTPSAATDTVNCANPVKDGSNFSCSLTLASTSEVGSCTTWSGSGTQADPYNCVRTNMAFVAGTPATLVKGAAVSVLTGGADATATCTSPTLTAGGVFSCGSLTLDSGESGTCTAWQGNGSSGSPFSCTAWGAFGSKTFVPSGVTTPASVEVTITDNPKSCSGSSGKISCKLSDGSTVGCTKNVGGGGSSGDPYYCTASAAWTFPASYGTVTVVSTTQAASATKSGTKWYKYPTEVKYKRTIYYASTYAGQSASDVYYYIGSYTISFSGKTYKVRVKVCDKDIGLESNCQKYVKEGVTSYKPTGVVQDNAELMRFGVTSYFLDDHWDNAVLRSKAKYVGKQLLDPSDAKWKDNSYREWNDDGTLVVDPDSADAATRNPAGVANSGVINYVNKFGTTGTYSGDIRYKSKDDTGRLYYATLRYLRNKGAVANYHNGVTTGNADGFPVIKTWDDPVQYSCQKNYIIVMGDTHTHCDKRLPGGDFTDNKGCGAYTDANGNKHGYDVDEYGAEVATGDARKEPADDVDVGDQANWVGAREKASCAKNGDNSACLNGLTMTQLDNLATTPAGVGSASFYIAGLAHWAAANDMRPDIEDSRGVPQRIGTTIIDVEEYGDCGFQSQYWLAGKYGNPSSYDAAGDWLTANNPAEQVIGAPTCSSRAPPALADGKVSWPKNLLRASDPADMIASVKSAIASIVAQNGQVAVQGQSSSSLIGGGAYVYQSTFDTEGWVGDLRARTVSVTGGVGTTPTWEASANLPTEANRVIYTYNDGLDASGDDESGDNPNAHKGVLFSATALADSPSAFSTRQKLFLNASPSSSTPDVKGAERISYLRGDRSNESPNGLKWRVRRSLLGDIVNSAPIYVGAPKTPFVAGSGYQKFVTSVKSRTPVVYVGSNDGMLHAFDASGLDGEGNPPTGHVPGQELMAFVPSSVYYGLNQLMWPDYVHRYYVDGSPTVADVCTGNCSDADGGDWKTILVSGLRAGGKGVFALDVTDPANFTNSAAAAASTVLWEFTSKVDSDLGYTFGSPAIRKMNAERDTGVKDGEGNAITVNKWAVVFGNGYNNTTSMTLANGAAAVGEGTSSTGRAAIYIVFVEGPGSGHQWTSSDYVKISLKSPDQDSTSPPNGLARIAPVDKNADGKIDIIYAGDLRGNLWKIDVSDPDPSKWGSAFTNEATGDPIPLFSATDVKDGNPQPITGGIQVSRHPDGGFMVMFGTGSMVYTSEISDTQIQTVYGIWDQDKSTQTVPVSRSTLQRQTLLATGVYDTTTYLLHSDCTPNYSKTKKDTGDGEAFGCPDKDQANRALMVSDSDQQFGWIYDMPDPAVAAWADHSKERVVMDRLVLNNGVLTVTSIAPDPNSDPCVGGTKGWRYDLDFLTGGRSGTVVYTTDLGGTTPLTVKFTIDGTTLAFYPSGTDMKGGSDTPAQFQMSPTAIPTNDALINDTAATTDKIGTTFIRGWGVPYFMKRGGGGAGQGGGGVAGGCSPTASLFPGTLVPKGGCNQGEGVVSWRQLSQ